jgi:DNA-binding MarR family transcriptional regulator
MQSLALLLHGAANVLKREFERAARPHGLTLMQWRALAVLSAGGPLTQSALAARLDVTPMTVSDLLERMEAAGLVDRTAAPTDSRAKLVSLTAQAPPLIEEMRGVAASVYARALDGVEARDRAAMERVLLRLLANLDEANTEKDKTA